MLLANLCEYRTRIRTSASRIITPCIKSSCSDKPHLALNHQGVALGWHYLVAPLVEKALLVRPVREKLVHKETLHYLNFNEEKTRDPSSCKLRDWLMEQSTVGCSKILTAAMHNLRSSIAQPKSCCVSTPLVIILSPQTLNTKCMCPGEE
jgi:hypothetical protein